MWRAGFGPAAAQHSQLVKASPKQLYAALQKASAAAPTPFDVADDYLKGLMLEREDAMGRKPLDAEQRRMVQQKQRQGLRNLNLAWMGAMVNSEAQLREKMAFFWHGHFACRNTNIFYQQQLLQVLRSGAREDEQDNERKRHDADHPLLTVQHRQVMNLLLLHHLGNVVEALVLEAPGRVRPDRDDAISSLHSEIPSESL